MSNIKCTQHKCTFNLWVWELYHGAVSNCVSVWSSCWCSERGGGNVRVSDLTLEPCVHTATGQPAQQLSFTTNIMQYLALRLYKNNVRFHTRLHILGCLNSSCGFGSKIHGAPHSFRLSGPLLQRICSGWEESVLTAIVQVVLDRQTGSAYQLLTFKSIHINIFAI